MYYICVSYVLYTRMSLNFNYKVQTQIKIAKVKYMYYSYMFKKRGKLKMEHSLEMRKICINAQYINMYVRLCVLNGKLKYKRKVCYLAWNF